MAGGTYKCPFRAPKMFLANGHTLMGARAVYKVAGCILALFRLCSILKLEGGPIASSLCIGSAIFGGCTARRPRRPRAPTRQPSRQPKPTPATAAMEIRNVPRLVSPSLIQPIHTFTEKPDQNVSLPQNC